MPTMRGLWRLSAAALLTLAPPALAGTPPSIAIAYRAPPSCPDASVFTARLLERAAVVVTVSDTSERTLDVAVEQRDASFVGRIVLRDRLGSETSRELSTATCSDVVDALALTAALSLEDTFAPPPALPESIEQVAPPTAEERKTPPGPAQRDWTFVARAEMGATYGYFPETIPAVGLTLGLARDAKLGFGPLFGAGVRTLLASDRATPAGQASFRWDLARLTACPIALALGDRFSWGPCLHADLGRISAQSRTGDARLTQNAFWASVAAGGVAAWRPAPWVSGGLEANLVIPFTQPTFGYGADYDVVQVGAIGADVGLFAAVHL